MITADQLQTNMAHCIGTTQYHKFSPFFPTIVLTDGAQMIADEAGAFWLMDLIASYQPKAKEDEMLRDFQVWTLNVKDNKAVIKCERDTDDIAFKQKIPFTDFPLDEIKFFVQPQHEFMVIMLTSEY